MSALGGIEIVFLATTLLFRTLRELQTESNILKEISGEYKLETCDGKIEKVDILVKDNEGTEIGFKKREDGNYYVVIPRAESEEMRKKQEELVNRIRRKYAYNLVKEDLKRKGFTIVEEKEVGKNTIKIVARRWR
ncbi:MAG TPA: DUF1257 domain-containing protein [Firmicutes bacterium]|nr:DUF1257 domain-containing protein [Bacillota bacterium]